MPILKFDDAPEFDLNGALVRGFASPGRGALETMCWRIDMTPGQRLPEHTHDHEEVVQVLSGRLTVSLDGEETMVGTGDTVMIPWGVLHFPYVGEEPAELLWMMPMGTVMVRPNGEVVSLPWAK